MENKKFNSVKPQKSCILVLVAVVVLMMVFLLQGCADNNSDTVATAPVEVTSAPTQEVTESPAIAEAPVATEAPAVTAEPAATVEPTPAPTASPSVTTTTATATAAVGYGGYFNDHYCYHHICISCESPVCDGSDHSTCAETNCAYNGWYMCGGHPLNANGTPAHKIVTTSASTATTPSKEETDPPKDNEDPDPDSSAPGQVEDPNNNEEEDVDHDDL